MVFCMCISMTHRAIPMIALHRVELHVYMYVTQFGKTILVAYNNFEQTIFGHFAQEVNEIWYPGRPVNVPPRYQLLPVYNGQITSVGR